MYGIHRHSTAGITVLCVFFVSVDNDHRDLHVLPHSFPTRRPSDLPHISGLELIEALKKDSTLASVPIMAVIAYAGKGDEDRIRAAGAEDRKSTRLNSSH